MRPPEFTGGNLNDDAAALGTATDGSSDDAVRPDAPASMRPPEFTGGNSPGARRRSCPCWASFNEAAGIHRRKHTASCSKEIVATVASMRPPEFTGGNSVCRSRRSPGP